MSKLKDLKFKLALFRCFQLGEVRAGEIREYGIHQD